MLQRECPPRCYFLEYGTQCEVVNNQMRTLIALSGTDDDNMHFELSEGSFDNTNLHRGVQYTFNFDPEPDAADAEHFNGPLLTGLTRIEAGTWDWTNGSMESTGYLCTVGGRTAAFNEDALCTAAL